MALQGTGQYARTEMCALVLEDNPVGADSRLAFESFPGEIEETYAVNEYREMGGDRMPQPSFVAYRGGNWSPFQLNLVFRAGVKQADTLQREAPGQLSDTQLQQLLIEMERKVRWCQALTFPLQRNLGETTQKRVLKNAAAASQFLKAASPPSQSASEAISNLRRNDPPTVLIVFGSWWTQRAYAKNVSIKWVGPWHPETVRPYGAEVSITFQPIKVEYPTWQSVRNQAGSFGYSTTTEAAAIGNVNTQRARDAQREFDNAAALGQIQGFA